jgi:glucose/arabinose dehydrogenase
MTSRARPRLPALLAATALIALLVHPLVAATLRTGFTETIVASGLASPTAMAFAPDGRIFVCQQGGQLRVIENGVLLAAPFVSLTVDSAGERGLLGVAFDPGFASNHFLYLYYTATTPVTHNRVSRFTANGNVVVAGSEVALLDLNPLSSATNHNGGAMHFGNDGKLYVAVGENANGANSQTLANLLGKMLRINSDGSIPTDNPFFAQATGVNRAIWALGLRNPFTFAFHSVSGRMFINDVGQNTWEEINVGAAGANYGWPTTEGATSDPNFTTPLYFYGHGTGPMLGCAITGGTFYPGVPAQFPSNYVGDYFFADYCGGWINQLDESSGVSVSTFASQITQPVDLEVGPEGGLYYLARGSGSNTGVVSRIDYTASLAPAITGQPSDVTVSVGQPATFTVTASGAAPLSYQWQRNTAPIAGATASSYTLASTVAADNGAQFRCVVTNTAGSATSNSAVLTVVSNQPPVPTILTPAAGTLYTAGGSISYSGSATDPEDGTEPASRFTWEIVFHHDTHTHPFIAPFSGVTSGSFAIPDTGETSANVWYRIHLTVTDSNGQTATTYRDVLPRTVNVTVASNPAGLNLTLDGQPVVAPVTFLGVVGMRRVIGAVSSQSVGSTTYEFRSWSDRGAQTHMITTPSTATTFTASYWKRKGH